MDADWLSFLALVASTVRLVTPLILAALAGAGTAARLSGDEFAVLLNDIESRRQDQVRQQATLSLGTGVKPVTLSRLSTQYSRLVRVARMSSPPYLKQWLR